MILAAILIPEDFGVVAIATLVISFASIIVGMGFGATVIQRRTLVNETANMSFWMSLILAILLYGILWNVSPSIASFYKITALTNVLRVIGLSLIISAFSTIPTALLQKELLFKKLFFIGAGPQIFNGVISVALALLNFGFWSLVIGYLAGIILGAILTWVLCAWKPMFIWRKEIFTSILNFSFWILISNFTSWFYLYSDNAIAGYFFGSKGIGQYSLGFNISMLLPGMIIAPIASIAYPVFCKIIDPIEIGKELLRFQSLSATILFPFCMGLSVISPSIISIIYGNKWPELGMIIQMLSILPGMINVWSLSADAFRSIGRPKVYTQASMAGILLLLPILYIAGHYGLREFVFARFLGSILTPIICLFLSRKLFNLSVSSQINNVAVPFLCTIVMIVPMVVFIKVFSPIHGFPGVGIILMCSAIGGVIYLISLRFINRSLFDQIYRLGRQAIYSRG